MKPIEIKELDGATVSYEEAPIAETIFGGSEYRVDLGRGSEVAVSQREEGTWSWRPLTQGRWDGVSLKAKSLDFALRDALSKALVQAMRASQEGS